MLSIRPASLLSLEERRRALALLVSLAPTGEQAERVELGLSAFEQGHLDPGCFLTAWVADSLAGILACEILPGRAASLSPIRCEKGLDRTGIEDALLAHAVASFQERGAKFAQALLAPADREGASALERNGFRRMTCVWIMRTDLSPAVMPATGPLQFESRSESNDGLFQQLLAATFQDTLDCPELNDIRTPDEVYAGYLNGSPDPAWWWLARDGAEPVGLLIVSGSASPGARDLAYLGLVPKARRRGIARSLLAFALHLAAAGGANGMTLMVDERNLPAISLYQRFGFQMIDMRDVYIY